MIQYSKMFFAHLRGLLLLVLATAWLAGIILGSWLFLPPLFLLLGIAITLIVAAIYRDRYIMRTVALALLFLFLGAWRYTAASTTNDPQAINRFLNQTKPEVIGDVVDEPELETNSTLLIVAVSSISLDSGQSWQAAHGEIAVQTPGSLFDDPYAPRYGDTIRLTGHLTAPPSYGSPEILASMTFPGLSIVSQNGNPLLVALYQVRTDLSGILRQALPQPAAALLIALLLSLRTPALKPLIQSFNVTGTAHLIAPSGFKVSVMAGLINGGTRWLTPRPGSSDEPLPPAKRWQRGWRGLLRTSLIVTFIATYTFLNGGGPAAIRAGIMGILLVLAPRLGRSYNIFTALALAALFMSLADPFVLWDTGFQLSFIGTLGITLFTPFFCHHLRFLQRLPLGNQGGEILAVTLAAQVATLPIFALSFNQISFIAPFANIASVPLLNIMLMLGILICLGGLLSVQLATICGWIAWPLLWYIIHVISWCARLPGAYLSVNNLHPIIAWVYYPLLACLSLFLLVRWQPTLSRESERSRSRFSQKARIMVYPGLALLIILTTGALAYTHQPPTDLSITLLISSHSAARGEALLLKTPDGQTALIDEDATNPSLTQALDAYLPSWQRSLNLVILTDTSASDVAGLQDIITRYQIAQVVDGGMLHPSLAYALWRRTVNERHLPYTQVRQGATIRLGNQVRIQVLWPPAQLHKSSNEDHDNALVLRLLAPGLRMLLLNSTALSDYALRMLPSGIDSTTLQTDIGAFIGEQDKPFPASLSNLLMMAHPKFLFVSSLLPRKNQPATNQPSIPLTKQLAGPWRIIHTEQAGPLTITASTRRWDVQFVS